MKATWIFAAQTLAMLLAMLVSAVAANLFVHKQLQHSAELCCTCPETP